LRPKKKEFEVKISRSILVVGTLFALAVQGAFGAPAPINLYSSGSDNVRITWEAVLAGFKKVQPDITVNLVFLASGTGGTTGVEKLIAATKAGQKEIDIDLIETSDNDLARMLKEAGPSILAPLTVKDVPNLAKVLQKSSVAPTQSVPFRGTTVLLAYNSAKVPTPPKTAEELVTWIKTHPGRFAYNDPTTGGAGSSFVVTSIYNQLPAEALTSLDEQWKAQWDKGFDLLKSLHPFFYKASGKVQYPVKNQGTLDLLAAGEVDMIPAWADMVLDQKSRGLLPPTTKLTQITPSFTGGIQTLAVPGLSKNKAAAAKLLNFVTSPEGQQIFVESQKAIPVVATTSLPKSTDLLSGLEIKGFRLVTIGQLGDALNKRWQSDIATLP
jgi:putative spermidine/putrescine transport system substrate-binding protein